MAQSQISILKPDDWHVHLRDAQALQLTVPHTSRCFRRAIIMPNLTPAITTIHAANAYKERILAAVPKGTAFDPLMTFYLTDASTPDELEGGFEAKAFVAAKIYPAHATTNSAAGVTDVRKLKSCFSAMQNIGMPLLLHGEVTDPNVDIFDREAVFIERDLKWLVQEFPKLKIVLEHITTSDAVAFIRGQSGQVAATITAHHLMLNRNAMFKGGFRPHAYCLPVAKREAHRLALRAAAVSGESVFFLGTDSAPHSISAKESSCGCAGIFSSPCALESYAQVFAEENQLARLENFASVFGAKFYGLPVNTDRISLTKTESQVPTRLQTNEGEFFIPFRAGETLQWKVTS